MIDLKQIATQPSGSTMWTRSFYCVFFGLLFTASSFRLIGAQSNTSNFTVDATAYDCSSNGTLICLGDARRYDGDSDGTLAGSLSLIREAGESSYGKSGIAYYNKRVRMRDFSTGQLASFKTHFWFHEVPAISKYNHVGDGITFVISADNETLGSSNEFLGFFGPNGTNSFKSVVVEFDNFMNDAPAYDIGWNHVSLDFTNITYVAAENASDVNVNFWQNSTVYAWVEYTAATNQFEVRVSDSPYRPVNPLLNYTVDLFDKVEEYMWIGFSGATGGSRTYYYFGDWTFESSGIRPTPESRSKVGSLIAISVGATAAVLGIVGIFVLYIRLYRTRIRARLWDRDPLHEDPALQLASIPMEYRFSYNQLSVATGGFSEESKLGQGGFGSVYRGVLPRCGVDVPVAVKRINRESKQGEKEFMAEVSIISQLRHRNLIQLLGWCDDNGEYLIVYELMPNQSLDKVLFRPDDKHTGLSWAQRFNIVAGTAAAVHYLHQGWNQRVIHRDIKASNIMLDNEWNAKLGDFGLARLVDHERTPATTMVAGTYGYIAPEAGSGRYTEKTDVFAFGAVALEIACGRKAVVLDLPPDEIVLANWVWQRLSEGDLLSVVDGRLIGEYDDHWMKVLLLIGLHCSNPNPEARPPMRHVVQVLAGDVPVSSVPASKPVPMFGFGTDSKCISINDLQPLQTISG